MKRISIILVGILISVNIFAQGHGNRMEIEKRYRSQKIAFITDEMQLTPEEAQVFWPLYKQFENEKDGLANEMRDYRDTFPKEEADLTEEQALALLSFSNMHKEAMLKVEKEYQKKLLKIISARKVLLLIDAENGFRRHLLQEFRGKGVNRRRN
ncbi:MAG: hypothetical protein J7J72_04265 [Bacteroidales bacterium]|nr:hypothetical protein [Bacteroidales bacterium]